MGTVFTVTTVVDEAIEAVDEVFAWLHHVEEVFSTFIPESEISRIGRGELSADEASADVRHVLSRCEELETATGGRFTIRPGSDGAPTLDPSGFVKGWSVDEAALILHAAGIDRFMIDAGGDVLCAGHPPDGGRWRIGLRDPRRPAESGATLLIASGGVATSGTYIRGEHIWGDHVGEGTLASATVVGPSLGIADALATAIFADQAKSLAWMSAFPGYGVLLVTPDGKARWTEDLRGIVTI